MLCTKLLNGLYVYQKPGMGQFGSHTYVIVGTKQTLLIDPGFEENLHELVVEKMVHDGIDPHDVTLVANTHLHTDHSQADEAFAKLSGARIVMHATQMAFLDSDASADEVFSVPGHIDSSYGDEIDLGGIRVRVIETPGHAPGHVCFYWPEQRTLISGDMVFENNIGRFDLPGGDFDSEQVAVRKLAAINAAVLLPSHGKLFLEEKDVKNNFEAIVKGFDGL
ncbi:MAG: MBL fold metallo-hydrolase [Candidatus Aenigmarchaeota archaeon]|nr:MBL fold metallo-hydrolase [Candidatus Aenigmarchaeota archaeon]